MFPLRDDGSPDYCSYYQPLLNVTNGLCSQTLFDSSRIVSCPPDSQYAFDSFEFEETLVTELNSVCGKVCFKHQEINDPGFFRSNLPSALSSVPTLLVSWLAAPWVASCQTGLVGDLLLPSPSCSALCQTWLALSTATCLVSTPMLSPDSLLGWDNQACTISPSASPLSSLINNVRYVVCI